MRFAVEHFHRDTQTWHAFIVVHSRVLAQRIEMERILATGDDGLGYRITEIESIAEVL